MEGIVRVKCLAQDDKTMYPVRARTRTARSGYERTNHEPTAPPTPTERRNKQRQKTSRKMKGKNNNGCVNTIYRLL